MTDATRGDQNAGLRIGSLFSGIGGLELGLEWAGVGHTVWQVEIDPFCRDVLAHHWPEAQRYDDVRTVGNHNLEAVDVICGGYPCQPFSIAGKQLGEADPRHLWPEFARLLGELRPRYAVLENVPAHLGLGFGSVLGDLSELGYDAEWQVLSAREVGAPHLRQRVFVLAYASGERVAGHCQSFNACQVGVAPEMGERWTRGPRNMRELCDNPFIVRWWCASTHRSGCG